MLIKKGALKNSTNHTGEAPILKSPSTKPQALRSAALLKRDCNIGALPLPPPPSPPRHTAKLAKPPRTTLSTEHLQ